MVLEKLHTEKIDQVKETIQTSWRMLVLVFKFEPWLFSGNFLFSVIPAVIPFLNFYIYKLIIDLVVASFSGTQIDFNRLYLLIGFRVATYFIQDASFRTQDFLHRLLWTKMPIYFNELVFGKTSSLDIHYFENPKFRDLLEKVRDAAVWRPQQLVEFSFMWVQSLIQVLIAFGAIARLNIFLVVLVAAISIPEFLNQAQQSKLSWGVWGNHSPYRKKFWYLTGLLQNSWTIKEIKLFRLARGFLSEIKKLQENFYRDMSKLAKQNFGFGLTFNALSTAIFVGVEVFVILEAIAKRITVGDINFYTGVVSNFQNGLGGLFRNMTGIFENSLYVKSLFELLDTEPIINISKNPKKSKLSKTPLIEFKNISFAYPDTSDKVFSDFSLTINPGEKVALVGENGVGKTTLIKLLARFYDVDNGEILINGINIKDLDLESWYNSIGVLFQDFNKYEYPVKDNIAFGKIFDDVPLQKIIAAAKMAGADPMIQKLDKKYEQMLGKTFEGGKDLSGGQWQKIALARAFLRNAPVLILDEPTASLDAKAEAEVFGRVEKLSKDERSSSTSKTVIIISHRFSTVRNADKIYVIEKGKIIESGNHEELMKMDGQYATLFKLQAKGYQ